MRASAPARVNLIGEHTDYNGGSVLPTAIPQHTRVSLTLRTDHQVEAASANVEVSGSFTLGREEPRTGTGWITSRASPGRFARTAIRCRAACGSRSARTSPRAPGCLRAPRSKWRCCAPSAPLFDLHLEDVRLAQLGQTAENDFVGAHCGIMDQMAASLADSQTALFLDTRSLEFRRILLRPAAGLVVIHSGGVALDRQWRVRHAARRV